MSLLHSSHARIGIGCHHHHKHVQQWMLFCNGIMHLLFLSRLNRHEGKGNRRVGWCMSVHAEPIEILEMQAREGITVRMGYCDNLTEKTCESRRRRGGINEADGF